MANVHYSSMVRRRGLFAATGLAVVIAVIVAIGWRYSHWRELVGGTAFLVFTVMTMRAVYASGAERANAMVQSRTLDSTLDSGGSGGGCDGD